MTKTDFINAVAGKTGISKKDTETVINATISEIMATVAKGDNVQFTGFGTFEARKRVARTGVNPATKEKINIPATTVPAFKAGKAFKDAVK